MNHGTISNTFAGIIAQSGLQEFKWQKLRQARERFAANKLLDASLQFASENKLRVDVLIWDIEDSRHSISRRDDIANLERMYFHLFRNVFRARWTNDSSWDIFPDEQSALNWSSIGDFLEKKSTSLDIVAPLLGDFEDGFQVNIVREFGINSIKQVSSHLQPFCQIADLFAGIASYSYLAFDRYSLWVKQNSQQISIPFEAEQPISLTNSEKERFKILQSFANSCKQMHFNVGLNNSRGLRTYDPKCPINFWLYKPQTPLDKAPLKSITSI